MSFLALAAPAVAIALVVLFLWLAIRLLRRLLVGMRPSTGQNTRWANSVILAELPACALAEKKCARAEGHPR